MTIKVYKLDASPPARTVLMTAEILGLEIETREVNVLAKEQFAPEFLEKNPIHTIPLLEDKNFVLADSHAIIIYLVSKYGAEKGAQLYPNDLNERAIVHQRLFMDASILFPRLVAIVKNILYENAISKDVKQVSDVEEAYGFLEEYLERDSYIAGNNITIADIACVATVSSMNVVVPIDEKYSKLRAWMSDLSNMDWYKKKNEPGLAACESIILSQLQINIENVVG